MGSQLSKMPDESATTCASNDFLQHLECPICKALFTNPVSIKCGHCYCSLCIRRTLHIKSSCPICHKKATTSDINPVHTLSELVGKVSGGCDDGRPRKRRRVGEDAAVDAEKVKEEELGRRKTHLTYNTPATRLKDILKKEGLPTDGSKEKLARRHNEFVNRHNANLDCIHPKSHSEIVKDVMKSERSLDQANRERAVRGKVGDIFRIRKKRAEKESPPRNSFEVLIESAKSTLPNPKRRRRPVPPPTPPRAPSPVPPSPPLCPSESQDYDLKTGELDAIDVRRHKEQSTEDAPDECRRPSPSVLPLEINPSKSDTFEREVGAASKSIPILIRPTIENDREAKCSQDAPEPDGSSTLPEQPKPEIITLESEEQPQCTPPEQVKKDRGDEAPSSTSLTPEQQERIQINRRNAILKQKMRRERQMQGKATSSQSPSKPVVQ